MPPLSGPEQEELINDLRSALAHLDDPLYLERHALAERIALVAHSPEIARGQLLRRTLRLAIESLDPGAEVSVNSPEGRAYQVLHRHAIAKESMTAVALHLDISERQAYRELRRALESLAQILIHFDAETGFPPDETALSRAVKVKQELERLETVRYQAVALNALVADVVENVRPLARERGLVVTLRDETRGVIVTTHRVMLRQAILNLLSYITTAQTKGEIIVRLARADDCVRLQFAYRPANRNILDDPTSPYQMAQQLLDSLGIEHTLEYVRDGNVVLALSVQPAEEHVVLVIDDNSGIISLFRSYLRGQPYRVEGAANAAEALRLLDEVQPAIILLDVMMPDRDGWELLPLLRRHPLGARAKVIICSIINDPRLATALGADSFLHKPVDRADLLTALSAAQR